MNSEHVMIDLETLDNPDNSNSSLILSIAAIQFDPFTGETGLRFYQNIDIQNSLSKGLTIGGDTLKWWLGQDRAVLDLLIQNARSLSETLKWFNDYLSSVAFQHEHNRTPTIDDLHFPQGHKLRLWGRSPRFDLGILRQAYNLCGIIPNWNGKNELDVRTMEWLNPSLKATYDKAARENNTYLTHDPILDCKHQINYTSGIRRSIKIENN